MTGRRYITDIFTANLGYKSSNLELKEIFFSVLDQFPAERISEELREKISYFLMGDRTRFAVTKWDDVSDFSQRASLFEESTNKVLDLFSQQIRDRLHGTIFDALVTTTSTGSLMPGISYRLAAKIPEQIRPDTMLLDLAHVGCTGGIKALNMVRPWHDEIKNILIISVEFPSTLKNLQTTDIDIWQGNCTFGDGAAMLFVSTNPESGSCALEIGDIHYRQHAEQGLNLIRWGYSDYYGFRLADENSFNDNVRDYVSQSLTSLDKRLLQSPRWAIHPAGLALMIRLSRKLGISKESLHASADHYNRFSNMSSAGVLHILKDVAGQSEPGEVINLLTMGAGFNVIFGHLTKLR